MTYLKALLLFSAIFHSTFVQATIDYTGCDFATQIIVSLAAAEAVQVAAGMLRKYLLQEA
jgi:hypothetical protein